MKRPMKSGRTNGRFGRGFTLIELMVAVAVLGIIAAIAYPSYMDQVRKSRRTSAKTALTEVMQNQERMYTRQSTYTNDLTALGYVNDPHPSEGGYYNVAAAACAGNTLNQCVQITATAQGDQTNDECGDFTLDSRGNRGVTGTLPVDDCW